MPLIGNQFSKEKIQDHHTYVGDGIRTVFAVLYEGNSVLVFLNGIKLKETVDYQIVNTGNFIRFTEAPELNDTVDVYGTSEVTDLSRSTISKETWTAEAGQTEFIISTPLSGGERITVYLNGLRLSDLDYDIDYLNKKIMIDEREEDDVLFLEVLHHGFRSSMHNTKNEKASHPMFSTPDTINSDMVIKEGENAMIVGPIKLNSVIHVQGTLTIV